MVNQSGIEHAWQRVDLFEAGVIDPVKVTRSAVQNAASIASMLLTTEALIADIPELVIKPKPCKLLP